MRGLSTKRPSKAVTKVQIYDLYHQAKTASSDARLQRDRLHAARLRRQDFDAMCGLRTRFDLRRDHPGVLGARYRAASRGQALGYRLQLEDAGLFPRPVAWLQHRARTHAFGADRRESREQG